MRRGLDLRHPSSARLRGWLETGEPTGVGAHVEHCDRCADRLEELDRDEPVAVQADDPQSLRQALTELVSPPPDLPDRVLRGVERRQRVEREMMLFAGLFSIGVETAQLLIDQPAGDEADHDAVATAASEEQDEET